MSKLEKDNIDEKQKLINSILLLDTDSTEALFQVINAYGNIMNKLAKQDKILDILKKNTIYYSVDDNEYKIEINLTRDDDGFTEVLRWLNDK